MKIQLEGVVLKAEVRESKKGNPYFYARLGVMGGVVDYFGRVEENGSLREGQKGQFEVGLSLEDGKFRAASIEVKL